MSGNHTKRPVAVRARQITEIREFTVESDQRNPRASQIFDTTTNNNNNKLPLPSQLRFQPGNHPNNMLIHHTQQAVPGPGGNSSNGEHNPAPPTKHFSNLRVDPKRGLLTGVGSVSSSAGTGVWGSEYESPSYATRDNSAAPAPASRRIRPPPAAAGAGAGAGGGVGAGDVGNNEVTIVGNKISDGAKSQSNVAFLEDDPRKRATNAKIERNEASGGHQLNVTGPPAAVLELARLMIGQ